MMDTFDSEKFLSELDVLSKESMPGCGLVFELYQRRLSAAIDKVVAGLPEEQHACAFELARQNLIIFLRKRLLKKYAVTQNVAIVVTALIAIAALSVAVIYHEIREGACSPFSQVLFRSGRLLLPRPLAHYRSVAGAVVSVCKFFSNTDDALPDAYYCVIIHIITVLSLKCVVNV